MKYKITPDIINERIRYNQEMKERAIESVNEELSLRRCDNCIYVSKTKGFLGIKKHKCLITEETISVKPTALSVRLYYTQKVLQCPSYKNKLGL